jgi:hypothetical protein
MASKERLEALGRAMVLVNEAADNLRIAQELMLSVDTSGSYSKIIGAIHERVKTEAIICHKWFDNEAYDLVAQHTK